MQISGWIITGLMSLGAIGSLVWWWNSKQPLATDAHWPSREKLVEQWFEKGEITIVYGQETKALAEKLAARVSRRLKTELMSDLEVASLPDSVSAERCLVIVGTPQDNTAAAAMNTMLGTPVKKDHVSWNGKDYRNPGTALTVAFYPSPYGGKSPACWITAFSSETLVNTFENLISDRRWVFSWSAWGYEIFQQGERVAMGNWPETNWQLEQGFHYDFTSKAVKKDQNNSFAFYFYSDKISTTKYSSLFKPLLQWVGEELPSVDVYIHKSQEEKGLRRGNTHFIEWDTVENSLHLAADSVFDNWPKGDAYIMLLRRKYGKPLFLPLESGLAWHIADEPKNHQLVHRLLAVGWKPQLAWLTNTEISSPFIRGHFWGSFTGYLLSKWGKDTFMEKYKTWNPTADELGLFYEDWVVFLQEQNKGVQDDNTLDLTPDTASSLHPNTQNLNPKHHLPYVKGFNFAHEGYQVYNGYGSTEAAKSLQRQKELGCNAIAIVPYSFTQTSKPGPIPVVQQTGGENDEAVSVSIHQAQQLGMQVLLKPQLWLGGGKWPGDIKMQSEADWTSFFGHYENWILHYAYLATLTQSDALVIGTEMVHTTLDKPDAWAAMIQRIRVLYGGPLTYASNWGDEFENTTIWKHLDYVGIDCYYPLSKQDSVSDEELKKTFAATVQKIESVAAAYHKPYLFTEIGFRSIPKPWLSPHAGDESQGYKGEDQARCYEAVLSQLQGRQQCQGIIWWKFPSYLGYRGSRNTDFNPYNKPASAVVKKYFNRL